MLDSTSKKLSIGLLGSGGKLIIEDGFLRYTSPYGSRFQVALKDISTFGTDTAGFGKSTLKVIGHGAVLAEVKMPATWAEKCQRWILNEMASKAS